MIITHLSTELLSKQNSDSEDPIQNQTPTVLTRFLTLYLSHL